MDELEKRLAEIEGAMRSLDEAAGDSALTVEQQTEWDSLETERAEKQKVLARRQSVRSLAARPGHTETGDGVRGGAPTLIVSDDPFDALARRSDQTDTQYRRALVDANLKAIEGRDLGTGDNEAHFERTLKRHSNDVAWAASLLARSRPEYETGFSKLMLGRGELLTNEERTAMSVGSNTNGGYLLPTHLDPTIILTNSGSSNVIRQIAKVVTLGQGLITWNGVTSAGVTASWDGELAEVSDDTPTMARVSIATNVAQAFVQGSIAAFDDIAGLQSDVMMLFADARDRLEGAAHATGSGSSNQPKGIFTAANASTGVQVTSTTGATIGEVDIHALYRAVPVRWRGRGIWLTNPLYALAVKRLGTAVSSSFSGDLTQPTSERWLGRPVVESDDAPTTQTTTALDNEIIFGDIASAYTIVDKPGGMSVEFVPQLFNTANNLPDGRRGFFAYWRTGADAVNLAALRMLVDKTTA
jgi:HK97 family phage major capsid protein